MCVRVCVCSNACILVCICLGAVVQWVKGDDAATGRIWGVVHCNGRHNETLHSPRQQLTNYSH